MAEGAYGRFGIARTYALIFGIAYLAVALLELFFPLDDPLTAGDSVILARTTLQNLVHWAVGIVILGSFFAGEVAARNVARIVGIVFVVLTLLGLFASNFTAELLGFPEGSEMPGVYNLVHAVTAIAALYAGFAGGYRRTAMA